MTRPAMRSGRLGRLASADNRSAVRWQVGAVVLCHVLLLSLSSMVFPLYFVPDESFHADLVRAASSGNGWPDVGTRELSAEIEASRRLNLTRRVRVADEAVPRAARPPFAELAEFDPFPNRQEVRHSNRATQHPPLYYVLAGTFANAVTGMVPLAFDLAYDQLLWLYRWVGVLCAAPLPLIAALIARRLGADPPTQVAAAVVPLTVTPLTLRAAPMVNNDALLIALFSAMTLLFVAVAQGDRSRRTAITLGVVAGAAMLTKAYGLMAPFLAAGAYGLAWLRARRDGLRTGGAVLRASLLAGMTAALLGGWWWLRNLLLFGTVQPSGVERVPAPAGFDPDFLAWLVVFAKRMTNSFWLLSSSFGPMGSAADRPAEQLSLELAGALPLLLAAGAVLAVARRRPAGADAALAIAPTAAMLAGAMLWAWPAFVETARVGGAQGRYLYPGLVGLAAAAVVGYQRLLGRHVRWLPVAVAVLAVALQWLALRSVVLSVYATNGPASLTENWRAVQAWSPWPAWVLDLLALGCAAAGAAMILVIGVHAAVGWRAPEAAPAEPRQHAPVAGMKERSA